MTTESPKVVSLFAGAGGCDIGLENAGFVSHAATDYDETCIESLNVNKQARIPVVGKRSDGSYLETTTIIQAPVADLQASDLWSNEQPPDLLVGGPPCQPFSSAGRQKSVDDSRGRLFEDFVRLADALSPRLLLFENVRGLVTARGPSGKPGEALYLVRQAFEEIGYATTFGLLNAADFGLPQRRIRLFMMGSRDHRLPVFPKPTHAEQPHPDLFRPLQPWVTLGDFLASREEPGDNEVTFPSKVLAAELSDLPDGSGLKSKGAKEPTRPGGHWGYRQGTFIADQNLPARTVTASSSQDWIRDRRGRLRRLTVGEAAGLQGFPPCWKFSGSKARQYRQIGNAVPPPLAQVLGESLYEALQHECRFVESEPFPDYMRAAITYTRKEDRRNGVARVRSPHYAGGD